MSPQEALKTYFALEQFRAPQQEIIGSVLAGKDTLVVMPTGGGKSLCYQLPAMILPGVTLVVSPLIALMKDQVDTLCAKGLPAGLINSMQSAEEQRNTLQAIRQRELKLVYVAPERFRSQSFLRSLPPEAISLLAIDEAHCLSQWGHDFRPDYMRLGAVRKALGNPPCVALTATATPDVQSDIKNHLELRDPAEFVAGFARPNLSFRILQVGPEKEKYARLQKLLREQRTGIVYCATRKSVENVTGKLKELGEQVICYHGGLSDNERNAAQEAFMSRKVNVVVATNAFGMGIDRADIRFVCHFEMPGSVEAYYQEGGRAGRDGKPAVCEMLFSYADKRIQDFFIEGTNPGRELITQVFDTLRNHRDEQNEVKLSIDDLAEQIPVKVNPMAVGSALALLSRGEWIERFDVPGQRIRGTRILKPELTGRDLPFDAAALAEKRQRDDKRLQAVIQFAYARKCRQSWILEYFGERSGASCGQCDHCQQQEDRATRPGNPMEIDILRKALSGIARMSRRVGGDEWQPRFGKRKIIQCLMASQAENMKAARLHELSTFGILKGESRSYLEALFDEMENSGLVEIVESEGFPLLGLTAVGAAAMRNADSVELEWPEHPGSRSRKASAKHTKLTSEENQTVSSDLYQQLTTLRNQLAQQRRAPAYTIFPNSVLESLARMRPRNTDEASLIKGIGPTKLRTVLPAFLELIRSHE